ncbi:MAG: ribbon-helix-helix domain-containing protein [Candidatus Methanomethylicaceae archaeon]
MGETITISFQIPKKLLDEIDKLIKQKKFMNRSDFLRYAIRNYLDKIEGVEK